MMKRIGALTLIAMLSSTALAQSGKEIRIASAKSTQEQIFAKLKEPFEKETGIKLTFVKAKVSEAYGYFEEVAEGRAEAAAASLAFDTWMEAVKQAKVNVPSDITHRIIGRDVMTIITNKNAGVTKLSVEQLGDILSGKVKNWKELGGSDVPITVMTYANKQAKNLAIRKLVIQEKPFGAATKSVPGEEEAIVNSVAETPGGLGYLTLDVVTPKVTTVETPPIGRPITLINRGQPSENLQKLISYIRAHSK